MIASSATRATARSRMSPSESRHRRSAARLWPRRDGRRHRQRRPSGSVPDSLAGPTHSSATRETERSRTSPRRPGSAATATGRPRRPSPTSTATATSISTFATISTGTASTRSACWDKARKIFVFCGPPDVPVDARITSSATTAAGSSTSRPRLESSTRTGQGLGVVATDLDGDGRVDLFVANDQSAKFLFLNRGGLRFEEVGRSAGVASNASGVYQASMGVACGDLDGDGLPDLAVTNFYNEYTAFYQNLGERRLQRSFRGVRPGGAQPLSSRIRDRLPRLQQRRPARPGHRQRPRRRSSDRRRPADARTALRRHAWSATSWST